MHVLYVVHALPPDTYGGTECYTKHLAETVAADHEVTVATPRGRDADVEGASVVPLPASGGWTDPTGQDSGLGQGVTREAVDRCFAEILDALDPDVVHVQHLKHLSAGLPAVCRGRGVGCVVTLHDFWTACHREQLYRPDGTLCTGPESVDKCTECYVDALRRATATADSRPTGAEPGDPTPAAAGGTATVPPTGADGSAFDPGRYRAAIERRGRRLAAARAAADALIAPSAFLRDQYRRFGTPADRIVHCRNGVRIDRFADTGFDPSRGVAIGYAGRITPLKGVHLLIEAFRTVAGDATLHVFGRFDPAADPYHARLRERADERVTFHGWYADAAAPYERVDVLVVPSLWYENSPLVIQEAFASRVPVVTADAGGMAELVTHGEDGLTFAIGDADALAERLRQVVESPSTIRRLRNGIEPPTRLADHAAALLDVYADCAR